MRIFGSGDEARTAQIAKLADQIAEMRAEVKALTRERANLQEVARLDKEVERLKLEKGRLTEDNDRKIRETEHKTGLLRKQQEHDVSNAKRETMLEVREENLSKDQQRFTQDMEFMRERMQGEVDRVERVLNAVLARLPDIEATFAASTGQPAKARGGDA